MWMGTIITLIGAAALGLIAIAVIVLWRRTHRELLQLRRDLLATQQRLEIHRILAEDDSDGPPQRRRHLRALALFAPLLPIVTWVRDHAAVSTAAVGTLAVVVILAQAGAPSELRQLPQATPVEPLTPPPTISATSPSVTAMPPAPTHATPDPSSSTRRGSINDTPTAPTHVVPTPPPAPGPSISTTISLPPTSGPVEPPPPGESPLLCVELDVNPLTELALCALGNRLGNINNRNG